MLTNHTQRATVRPSRLRIARALARAWYDRHADAVSWCALSAFTVAFALAFTYALTIDAPSAEWISANPVLAFVGIAFSFVAFAFVVGAFVHLLTQDITARNLSRSHSRTVRRITDEWARELAKSETALALAKREASRNAYALLTALEETDTH